MIKICVQNVKQAIFGIKLIKVVKVVKLTIVCYVKLKVFANNVIMIIH